MAMDWLRVVCVLLSVWMMAPLALSAESEAPSNQQTPLNVILISLDTVRPDHLSCYGYGRTTTPNIDQLAREGAVFTQAFAQAPFTFPSHYALFTSQYPRHWSDGGDPEAGHAPELTLTAIMKRHGYTTAAYHGFEPRESWPAWMLSMAPFQQFHYEVRGVWLRAPPEALYSLLDRGRKTPFFIFLHGYDAHEPHLLPAWCDANRFDPTYQGRWPDTFAALWPAFARNNTNHVTFDAFYREQLNGIQPADVEHLKAVYDAQIYYLDQGLGRVLTVLKNFGLADRTVIIIVSDHGQMFGEHGEYATHNHCYDEIIHTVLIVKDPRRRLGGVHIPRIVQLVDVMPTILELTGIPLPPGLAGRSLVPLLDTGRDERREEIAITVSGPGGTESIRSPEWKLITLNGAPAELYHLSRDPGERTNRINEDPSVVRKLQERLSEVTGNTGQAPAPSGDPKEWLQKHGYW